MYGAVGVITTAARAVHTTVCVAADAALLSAALFSAYAGNSIDGGKTVTNGN